MGTLGHSALAGTNQIFGMERFTKIVYKFKQQTIFRMNSQAWMFDCFLIRRLVETRFQIMKKRFCIVL